MKTLNQKENMKKSNMRKNLNIKKFIKRSIKKTLCQKKNMKKRNIGKS